MECKSNIRFKFFSCKLLILNSLFLKKEVLTAIELAVNVIKILETDDPNRLIKYWLDLLCKSVVSVN